MNNTLKNIITFIKRETIFTIAILLAVVSSFFVLPDAQYIYYVDWNTLLLLFSLMAVMAGFQQQGVFTGIARFMLSHMKNTRQLMLTFVFLPFFFSMLITNDVALITFVPFAIIILSMSKKEHLLIPLIVFQTLAANLGSMLTPMGNPQNLYLYSQSGLSLLQFTQLMLPYSLVSAFYLLLAIMFTKKEPITPVNLPDSSNQKRSLPLVIGYILLFLICILSVLKWLPPIALFLIIGLFLLIFDRSIYAKIDYTLLGTFIGFFVFIGNMSRIEVFRQTLQNIVTGHEILTAILSSQVISNVPAALLLSGFTENYPLLLIGTNLGGLGTLIASMASLISYKQIAREYPDKRSQYLSFFTMANVVMLGILLLFHYFFIAHPQVSSAVCYRLW